jgi:hypothetical protein
MVCYRVNNDKDPVMVYYSVKIYAKLCDCVSQYDEW